MKKVLQRILFLVLYFSVDLNSQSNTVLITASTGAFGESISFALAAEGCDLIIAGRDQKKLDNLENRIKTKYKQIDIQKAIIDFSDLTTIKNAVKLVEHSQIKGIVLIGPRPLLGKGFPSAEEWSKAFTETFIAPLEVIRLFGVGLQNNGSVVIVSGNSSKNYLPNYPNTNVMRLAWSGEVKNLVHFFADRKIRVNVISPGPIFTKHHEERIKVNAIAEKITFEEQLAKNVASIPLKAYGKIDDVSNLVSFLLSDKSSHINGSNILLDGGESTAY